MRKRTRMFSTRRRNPGISAELRAHFSPEVLARFTAEDLDGVSVEDLEFHLAIEKRAQEHKADAAAARRAKKVQAAQPKTASEWIAADNAAAKRARDKQKREQTARWDAYGKARAVELAGGQTAMFNPRRNPAPEAPESAGASLLTVDDDDYRVHAKKADRPVVWIPVIANTPDYPWSLRATDSGRIWGKFTAREAAWAKADQLNTRQRRKSNPSMTAAEKLAMVENAWKYGKTVFFSTQLRAHKFTAKAAAAWAATGKPLVKVKGNSLYILERKSYVCADYCAIQVQ